MMILRVVALSILALTGSQQAPVVPPIPPPKPRDLKPAAVEKLSPGIYRVGSMTVDTNARELIVPGVANDVETVEFVAGSKEGFKGYECALTLDTNAISFNVALMLLGLDPARGKPAKMQFDPAAPAGDPVQLTVEWQQAGSARRVGIRELLVDQRTSTTLADGPWVYTGSSFINMPDGSKYLADIDGVLIGLMHAPQAIIDNPRNDAVTGFGAIVLNRKLGIAPGSPIKLIVKALNR